MSSPETVTGKRKKEREEKNPVFTLSFVWYRDKWEKFLVVLCEIYSFSIFHGLPKSKNIFFAKCVCVCVSNE